MSSEEPDKHEKTEQATPFKLEEAKKKGSVAKSQEVNSLLVLSAVLLLLFGLGNDIAKNMLALCVDIFSSAGKLEFSAETIMWQCGDWIMKGLAVISPITIFILIVGVLANLMQTGPIFSTFPLKPDLKKINPVKGFKKLFSKKTLFDTVKNVIKLGLMSSVLYFAVEQSLPDFIGLLQRPPSGYIPFFIMAYGSALFKILMVILLIALIDFLFVRWEFSSNMKMTRKEVKDESKRRDGDPLIKSKRRELEKELRKRSETAQSVPGADLIITNPTHYAVALKYDRSSMAAPTVVAKGTGEMALRIREIAFSHRVPVFESARLTRQIFKKTAVDNAIPEDTYVLVAKLLRKAYAQKNKVTA
ncbi:flagellar biosynthesis protein FlhB [Gammaproteobacteria bacterium 45_16_T64]|nr:flagellar biosynthesis protein FlhB [Gammaproteobacteria bacterium 45_16_T64]